MLLCIKVGEHWRPRCCTSKILAATVRSPFPVEHSPNFSIAIQPLLAYYQHPYDKVQNHGIASSTTHRRREGALPYTWLHTPDPASPRSKPSRKPRMYGPAWACLQMTRVLGRSPRSTCRCTGPSMLPSLRPKHGLPFVSSAVARTVSANTLGNGATLSSSTWAHPKARANR
jgi:hypothetical protein